MHIKSVLLTATALGLMLPFTPAFAQNAPAAAASSDESEIIVTARKRQESILKVPVTETVLSSVQIERKGITTLQDVSKVTVGLKLGVASVETGSLVSIRGFGTNATDPGVDQSVSLNLDGLQLTEGMSYEAGTFDMQQIEVLKGPQALFFGKASPAGVISIRTNDPGDHLEVIGRTGYEFEAHESRNELIVSTPVTDTFGVRVAGLYDHFGGFFFNNATPVASSGATAMPHRFGETNSVIVRGTALWKPVSNFTARLKLTYTRDARKGGSSTQLGECPQGPNSAPGLPAFVPNQFSANENCRVDRNLAVVGGDPAVFTGFNNNPQGIHALDGGRPYDRNEQKFGSLELNYDVTPQIGLTSVTGFYKLKVGADYNCYSSGGGAPPCFTEKRLGRRDLTEELRAASDFHGPFNFTLGGFYQDGRIRDSETLPGNTNYHLPSLISAGINTIHIKSYSAFVQGRYKVVPTVELAAGVRYTNEKRRFDATTFAEAFTPFVPAGVPLGTPLYLTGTPLHSKNYSPEFTVTWTATDDVTLFGSWKKAYKSGSYNIITPVNPAGIPTLVNGQYVGNSAQNSYGDEKIQGFEIGLKTRFFDRQLTFNLTGYHYKASDLQVGTVEPAVNGLPVLNTLNAASAKIYGIEADFHYRPEQIPGLEFFGAVNWNHARFTSFPNAPCLGGDTYAEGCSRLPGPVASQTNVAFSAPNNLPPGVTVASLPQALQGGAPFRYTAEDLSGLPLVRAPDWTMNGGFHYDLPVWGDKTLGFGGDFQYSSRYLTLLGLANSNPGYYQRQYTELNGNISLTGRNGAWEVAFIANNLTNELIVNNRGGTAQGGALFFVPGISGGPTAGAAGKDVALDNVSRGRELWLRVTVKIGH
jgi:iron complex outermembrane receptor protein